MPFVLIILNGLVVAQMLEGWFNGGNASKVQQQSAADGNKAEEHLMSKEHLCAWECPEERDSQDREKEAG